MRAMICGALAVVLIGWGEPAAAQEYYPKDTETYLINYQVMAKDPATATMLSMAPGFGFGHFYAGQIVRGVIMALGEVLGLTLVLVAPRVGEPGDAAQDVLLYAGLGLFGGFKLADVYLASDSVELHNKNVARSLRIKPLVTVVEPGGTARPRVVAHGVSLAWPLDG